MQWDFHKRFQFLQIRFASILLLHRSGNWNFRQCYCRTYFSVYWCPLKLLIRLTFHFHKDWINLLQLFQRIHGCFPIHRLWLIVYEYICHIIWFIFYESYTRIRYNEWEYSLMNPGLLLFWLQFLLEYLNLKVQAWSQ